MKCAGVIASASKWHSRIAHADTSDATKESEPRADGEQKRSAEAYRLWAELLKWTFAVDMLECETCKGRMKLMAMVTKSSSIAKYLAEIGEPADLPDRSPSRGPSYWKSTVLRQRAPDRIA